MQSKVKLFKGEEDKVPMRNIEYNKDWKSLSLIQIHAPNPPKLNGPYILQPDPPNSINDEMLIMIGKHMR